MNIPTIPRFGPVLLALVAASLAGCQSGDASPRTIASAAPAGPATGAALLSSKKTFDIVGRTGKDLAKAEAPDPNLDVSSQTAREILESRGYKYQPESPDFVVSLAWNPYQKQEPPTPTSPQPGQQVSAPNLVTTSQFAIVARDAAGVVLWQSPSVPARDPQTITTDVAREITQTALKDFPPSTK